jgi:hypothetical protein
MTGLMRGDPPGQAARVSGRFGRLSDTDLSAPAEEAANENRR